MRTRTWTSFIRRQLAGASRVVVLGVGNPNRGDDGAGLACIRALRKARPRLAGFVRLIDAGPVPENSTGRVRRSRPSHVVIVDAARAGKRPGTVFPVDPRRIAHEEVSSHRTPLSWLARYLSETIGCRVLILGIQPARTEPSSSLSAPVEKSTESVAARLAQIFAAVRAEGTSKRPPRSSIV